MDQAASAGFDGLLSTVNTSGAYVSVTVDSNLINTHIAAIVQCLAQLKGTVRDISLSVAANTEKVNKTVEAMAERVATVEGTAAAATAELSDMAAAMKALGMKVDKASGNHADMLQRIDKLERKKVDTSHIEAQVAAAVAKAEAANDTATTALRDVAVVREDVATASGIARDALMKAELVLAVFEINVERAAAAIAQQGQGKKPEGAAASLPGPCAAYCHTLPSFATLKASLTRLVDKCREELTQRVTDDVADLRVRLNAKLDERTFEHARNEIHSCVQKTAAATTAVERLSVEMQSKVSVHVFDEAVEKLHRCKADRAELVGMVTKDDIAHFEQMVDDALARIDAAEGKFELGAREAALRVQARSEAPVDAARADELAALARRVRSVEEAADGLEERKADKTRLAELQAYVDGVLAAARQRPMSGGSGRNAASTPDVLTTPRKRLLSPISRPGSAAARSSIPDGTRPPLDALQYTSLPPRNNVSPERGRDQGASTPVFDSNGSRTSAQLSAKAVPAAEHWDNMRRVQEGDVPLPPGFVLHTLPVE